MFHSAKMRAKKEGLPFNLVLSDIVIPELCPVLGIPLISNLGKSTGKGQTGLPNFNAPTLDRIVPSLGYVRGNISVISWRANHIKTDATLEELQAIVMYLEEVTTLKEVA